MPDRRGRRPIDFQTLDLFDCGWFLAFRRLREGGVLPVRTVQWWTRRQIGFSARERLTMLERMTAEQYWAYFVAQEPRSYLTEKGKLSEWAPPPYSANREQAQHLLAEEIAYLKRSVKDEPAIAQDRDKGLVIWQALWKARTATAVEAACRLWSGWRIETAIPFPDLLLANQRHFLTLVKSVDFPRSESGDDARLAYLSRGMAGVSMGISPRTAVHRLRTMRHDSKGPLWSATARRCLCWRCDFGKDVKVFDRVVEAARRGD